MPKYVIHIGPPKAGSKYLQTSMNGLAKRLDRHAIHYPARLLGEPRVSTHAALDAPLRAGGPNPQLEKAFADMNAGPHKIVVLSWEGAFSLGEPSLQYFRQLIGPQNEVQLIYFVRRFTDRIPSLWKQDVKRGLTITLPETIVRLTRTPLLVQDQNAALVWERWAKVFGRDAINIVSLNNLKDHKVDLFDHFAATFLKWNGTVRPQRLAVHESPDAADTEITRALNGIHLGRGAQHNGRVFVAYMQQKANLDLAAIQEAMAKDTAVAKLDDRAGAYLPVYDAMMQWKDQLVSPEYGTEMFQRGTAEVEYVRQNYLLQPGVVPALQAIYRTLRPAITGQQPGSEAA